MYSGEKSRSAIDVAIFPEISKI